jgi:hypothetical protein
VSFYEGCVAFVRGQGNNGGAASNLPEGEIYPYLANAEGQCARPGTQISFKVEHAPIAEVYSSSSSFKPLASALRDKYWTFGRMMVKGKEIVVLVHKSETRIMIEPDSGRGMAFVTKDDALTGVNDLICEIRVRRVP